MKFLSLATALVAAFATVVAASSDAADPAVASDKLQIGPSLPPPAFSPPPAQLLLHDSPPRPAQNPGAGVGGRCGRSWQQRRRGEARLHRLPPGLSSELPTDPNAPTPPAGVKFKPDDCPLKSRKGDKLEMHYTGTLLDGGKQFDSSVGRAPFGFTIGSGQVIKGCVSAGAASARSGLSRTDGR